MDKCRMIDLRSQAAKANFISFHGEREQRGGAIRKGRVGCIEQEACSGVGGLGPSLVILLPMCCGVEWRGHQLQQSVGWWWDARTAIDPGLLGDEADAGLIVLAPGNHPPAQQS